MSLLGRHLTGLADFSGRENRQPFWLRILIVYAAQMVVGMIVMIPIMISSMTRMETMLRGDPQRFNTHPELAMQMMMPMMRNMMFFAVIMSVIWMALVTAAVTRRLHDTDRSGWWAAPVYAQHILMPLSYAIFFPKFFAAMGTMRDGMSPEQANAVMLPVMMPMMLLSLAGMVGFVMVIVLIVFLASDGTKGQNRFGADPLGVR